MPESRTILPNNWRCRPYQRSSWNAWQRGIKRQLLVWHRRAGKDEIALHKTAVAAHRRVGNYWHCLPKYEQARKAIWEAINPHSGKRRIDEAFPPAIRARTDNTGMVVEMHSGSIWRIVGSDNPDSLVGAPPIGIVFSEWALSNPSAWAYLAPALAENNGWADFITTPRGKNHVYSMLQMAKASEDWFAEVLTVNETGFPLDRVEEQRKEYHALYGQDVGDSLIQQEYFCSFSAATLGSYYGKSLERMEADGRLKNGLHDPMLPVHTAWDLGMADQTVIWCFQVAFDQLRVIDCIHGTGKNLAQYVNELNSKPYRYETDYVPHDARVRDLGTGRTRLETLVGLGRNVRLVERHAVEDGINALRVTIEGNSLWDNRCAHAIEALKQYHAEWDDETKRFSDKPYHDWTSDFADAARYMALAWQEVKAKLPAQQRPKHLVASAGADGLIKVNFSVMDYVESQRKKAENERY